MICPLYRSCPLFGGSIITIAVCPKQFVPLQLLGWAWASPTLVSWMAEFLWCIYHTYVQCTRTRADRHRHCARDLIGNMCACFYSLISASDFIVVCSEHAHCEYFQKSSEAIAKQATAHTRMRERARLAAETAEQRQERLMKRREIGLGALPRLPMQNFV